MKRGINLFSCLKVKDKGTIEDDVGENQPSTSNTAQSQIALDFDTFRTQVVTRYNFVEAYRGMEPPPYGSGFEEEALAENPLLQTPDSRTKQYVEKLRKYDANIKDPKWHLRSDQWSTRLWTASTQLRDYMKAYFSESGKPPPIMDIFKITGPWRNWVDFERQMSEGKVTVETATLKVGEQFGVLRPLTSSLPSILKFYKSVEGATEWFKTLQQYALDVGVDEKEGLAKLNENVEGGRIRSDSLGASGYHITYKFSYILDGMDEPILMWHQSGKDGQAWLSTAAFYDDAFLARFNEPLARLLNPELKMSYEEVMKDVATVHWLISISGPFGRGSAAIADLMSSSLLQSRGYHWTGWAPNKYPDVIALCTPNLPKFQAMFPTLLRSQGKLPKVPRM